MNPGPLLVREMAKKRLQGIASVYRRAGFERLTAEECKVYFDLVQTH